MHQPYKKWGAVAIALLLLTLPLTAVTLDDLLQQAVDNSSAMRNLEITRSNVLLQQAATKIDDGVKVSVKSGTLKYSNSIDTSSNWDISGQRVSLLGSSVEVALPNDGETTFTLSVDPFSWRQGGSSWDYLEDPSLSVSHRFTYGLTQDSLKDLNTRQTELSANSSYENTRLSFANTLYTQIISLVNNEKTIKSSTQKLADTKKALSDRLTLGQIKEGSLAYQAQDQAIKLSEGTLESLQATRDLLLRQFEMVVGVPYPDEITALREPNLSFVMNVNASTSIALKNIDLQKAKETLALQIAQYTNKALVVGGSASYTDSITQTSSGKRLTLGAQAALGGKNFSISTGVGGTYNFDDNKLSPSVSISGTWSNNPTSSKELLDIQQLENNVLLAEIAYNNAVDEYMQSAIDIQNKIASWQLDYALLLQTIQYNKDLLKQQQDLFEKGLATKKQVEDASFTVELDEYDLKVTLLEGLKLENSIKQLTI